MTPENFCYWMRGYMELRMAESDGQVGDLTADQAKRMFDEINSHLDLVLNKVTPGLLNDVTDWKADPCHPMPPLFPEIKFGFPDGPLASC